MTTNDLYKYPVYVDRKLLEERFGEALRFAVLIAEGLRKQLSERQVEIKVMPIRAGDFSDMNQSLREGGPIKVFWIISGGNLPKFINHMVFMQDDGHGYDDVYVDRYVSAIIQEYRKGPPKRVKND